jgi:hypothetical protein
VFSLETVGQFNFDKGRIILKEFIETTKLGEDVFVRYRVRFEVKSNLNFKYFPLDGHRLYIVLKNDLLAPSEVIITTYPTRTWFSKNAVSPNWFYTDPASDFGYIESQWDTRNKSNVDYTSAMVVYFDFDRATLRESTLVLFPLVVLLFIILGSLLIGFTPFQAIIIALLGIVGMIFYRSIINHMAPTTSYFMLGDLVFMLAIACALLVIIFEIMTAIYAEEEKSWFEALRGGVLTLASLIFLVGWFYLLYLW